MVFSQGKRVFPFVIGATISHYRIVGKLGEGGMGVVYKAEDTRLRRPVALKFLRREALDSPEHKQRFVREAQAAAALDHPNVCTVFEIDQADGQAFLVMALVEGQSVSSKIAERPLRLDEALDMAIQTAQGLQAAHEKGIVHRDIKPSNLIVNQHGQVKIMDFGLAQLADRSRLTQTTSVVGTVAYMSPEQAQRLPTDRRSDIWSLGVVLYEMVTGRVPFEGEHEMAIIYSIINEDHEPITALRVGLPTELDRIIAKAMAKDPESRYQHVVELRVDLNNLRQMSASGKVPRFAAAAASPPAVPGSPAARSGADAPPLSRADAPVLSRADAPLSSSRAAGAGSPSVAPTPADARSTADRARIEASPRVDRGRGDAAAAVRPKSRRAYVLIAAVLTAVVALAALTAWRFTGRFAAAPADAIQTATGDMRLIPAGEFLFGADANIELPVAKPAGFEPPNAPQAAILAAFYMDVTEVSNAAYKKFCDATGRRYPEPPEYDPNYFETKPDYPVVNVSFDDAQAFARWAGKRLPTEQEWEKAARGADGRIYPWGNTASPRMANAQGGQDGFESMAPVAAFAEAASPYGVLNLSGNVWEWTASAYRPAPQEITNINAWRLVANDAAWFVIKGGSLMTPPDDLDLMAFFRGGFPGGLGTPYQGFRCAMDPPE
jgi:formylglycine-generating enzyme required for sulfatase activity/tRNA A-37 threonylcarbamoyl transferase component Bud32